MIPSLYLLALTSCLFLILIFCLYFIWSITFGVPFVPSDKKLIKEMREFLKGTKVKKIAELGAGNGRVAFSLAEEGYEVLAVELNPLLTIFMRIWKVFKGYSSVRILNQNLFNTDVSQMDAVILYLFPMHMEKLEKKLFSDLRPGSYILSNTFKFKHHVPFKVISKIYIYKVAR